MSYWTRDCGTWLFDYFNDIFILFRIISLMKKPSTEMQFKNPVMWTFKEWISVLLVILEEKLHDLLIIWNLY